MESKTGCQLSSPSIANAESAFNDNESQDTFRYARLDAKPIVSLNHAWCRLIDNHRRILPVCTLVSIIMASVALIGLLVLNANLVNEKQKLEIRNQSRTLEDIVADKEQEPCNDVSGTVFVRWGVNVCPDTSSLIYKGVGASGSNTIPRGGGSNIICLTLKPKYGMIRAGVDDARSRIYAAEYRNGRLYGHMTHLHGHNVPCAACLTGGGRHALMMIPGTSSCPQNWTSEYYGILMSSRHNSLRTSYICVDMAAEGQPDDEVEERFPSALFPVETVCGPDSGMACTPYVNGNELMCAVCSM